MFLFSALHLHGTDLESVVRAGANLVPMQVEAGEPQEPGDAEVEVTKPVFSCVLFSLNVEKSSLRISPYRSRLC